MQAACYESLPPSRALLLTLRAKSEASVGRIWKHRLAAGGS